MKNKAYVDIKSWWASKINWAQGLSLLAGALTLFGVDLDAETQAAILGAIVGINGVVTWVLRTFFTTAIVDVSLPVGTKT